MLELRNHLQLLFIILVPEDRILLVAANETSRGLRIIPLCPAILLFLALSALGGPPPSRCLRRELGTEKSTALTANGIDLIGEDE